MENPFTTSRFPPPNRALRLIFEYRGDEVRLVSHQRIDMMTPPSDATYEYTGQSGSWFELKDKEGRVLYRQVLHQPIRDTMEAPSGDPARPFTHVRMPKAEGVFVLVAPVVPGAVTLVLQGSRPARLAEPARELVRIDLERLSNEKEG